MTAGQIFPYIKVRVRWVYTWASPNRSMAGMSQDEFQASYELVECRECGTEFNLGAQMYYDNLCPSCKRKA